MRFPSFTFCPDVIDGFDAVFLGFTASELGAVSHMVRRRGFSVQAGLRREDGVGGETETLAWGKSFTLRFG